MELQRQECEVYSRVVGYLRPLKQWNAGKTAEYHNRKSFDLNHNNKKYGRPIGSTDGE